MIREKGIQQPRIMSTSCERPAGDKPIQKLIKSGSGVLGKPRSRLTRKEMLQQLNEKKAKMSQLVEAASNDKKHSFT